MFDYKTFSYQGTPVSYAVVPMYMLNIIMNDSRLTQSAFKVFMRLMAYASCVNSCQFKITHAWLEKNTGLSDKTVARAMAQLKACGYVDDMGVVYMAPPVEAKRATVKQSLPVQRAPSVQVNHFPDATKMVEMSKPLQNSEPLDEKLDVSGELNDILRSLGSVKKVKSTPQTVQTTPQNSGVTPQNSDPYITIPNNTLLKNTPTASAEKVAAKKQPVQNEPSGLFSSTSSSGVVGFVEKSKPKPLASFIPTLGKNQTVAIGKPASLSPQHTSYIAAALQRMNVTSQSERKRYLDEIAYAATQGAFADTYRHTPLKAIRACLNLVEAGKWRANGGMY